MGKAVVVIAFSLRHMGLGDLRAEKKVPDFLDQWFTTGFAAGPRFYAGHQVTIQHSD